MDTRWPSSNGLLLTDPFSGLNGLCPCISCLSVHVHCNCPGIPFYKRQNRPRQHFKVQTERCSLFPLGNIFPVAKHVSLLHQSKPLLSIVLACRFLRDFLICSQIWANLNPAFLLVSKHAFASSLIINASPLFLISPHSFPHFARLLLESL